MRNAGVTLRGVALDSMVAAFLLDPSRMTYGIDRLALDYLNFRKVPTVELIGSGRNQLSMDRVELQKIACYASEDADIALRLADLLGDRLDELPAVRKLCDDLETPLIDALAELEFNGIAIDPAILKEQSAVLGTRVEELREKICARRERNSIPTHRSNWLMCCIQNCSSRFQSAPKPAPAPTSKHSRSSRTCTRCRS